MSYLLRVELPDVPGSLGRVATAIGDVGANIEAIEIVAHARSKTAINDIFITATNDLMPDRIVSACTALEDVTVHWISRYAAGGNVFLDLEAVEQLTQEPRQAIKRLVELLPQVFRVDWAALMQRDEEQRLRIVQGSNAAPDEVPASTTWPAELTKTGLLEPGEDWSSMLLAGVPISEEQIVVLGRRGGPEFLDSEMARFQYLVVLATTVRELPQR